MRIVGKKKFSSHELAEWLNQNFEKPSKKPFTYIEASKYAARGHLPLAYGGYKILKKRYYNKLIFILYE